MMNRKLISALSAIMLASVLPAPTASAGPLCEPRAAEHAREHGMSVKADSRWHVENGELPTCGTESSSGNFTNRDSGSRDEGKSRYCRKHWFC